MSIESALLLTESILLLVTAGLILYSIREGRQRSKLLVKVDDATKTLTRVEYFLTLSESISQAQEEIIGCVTGRRPTGDDEKRVSVVIDAIEKAISRGVNVKYLLPKVHDRLYMGYRYAAVGAEVRYASCSMVHSMRYIVVDDALVVIGIPEVAGRSAATSKGHLLPSQSIASIFRNHFYPCWKNDLTLKDYLSEVLNQTGMSIHQLSHEINIDSQHLETYIKT